MTINIIFDADDTLWAVEELYDQTRSAVAKLMSEMGLGQQVDIEEQAKKIDERNYNKLRIQDKVSPKRFPQSMVDTFLYFAEKVPGAPPRYKGLEQSRENDIKRIRAMGESVFTSEARVYDDTAETLENLKKAGCHLYLWTQGEATVQNRRIEQSGLAHFFQDCRVTDAKTTPKLQERLELWGLKRDETWMVGNSASSDIQPAMELGLRAVWVPAYSWRPDKPPLVPKDGQVFVVDSLKYLPEIILPLDNDEKVKEETTKGELAYLFVSAYHELYRQYVLDILAYPRGFIFKFPYDVQWLPRPYRQQPELFCAQMKGKRALVVFSEERGEAEPRRPQNFVPVRFAQIEKTPRVEGGTVYIEFILGDYVGYGEAGNQTVGSYKKSVDIHDKQIKTLEARPRLQRDASAYFSLGTLLADIKPVSNCKEDDNAWQPIVTVLSDLRTYIPLKQTADPGTGRPPDRSMPAYKSPFENVMFFRVQSLKKVIRSPLERLAARVASRPESECENAMPPQAILDGDSGYLLESSTNYRLSIIFRVAQRPSPLVRRSKVVANLGKDLLTGVGPTEIPLNFRYDLRHIDFITARVYDDTWGSLSLQIVSPSPNKEPVGTGGEEVAAAPAPIFLIKVKADRFAQIGAPLLFGISSAIASLNTVGAQLLTGGTKDHPPQELFISLLMGFAGSLGTTLTLYYLYRKLR